MSAINRAIEIAGSDTLLGKGTGFSQAAITQAKHRGRASERMSLAIHRFLDGAVSAHELRPDIWATPIEASQDASKPRTDRLKRHRIDLTGQKIKNLTVIEPVDGGKWLCRCVCGRERIAITSLLRRNVVTSCGQCHLLNYRKHGMAGHALYKVWQSMIQRCHCETNKAFRHYGSRGIRVCDEWRNSFTQFYSDMGEKPSPKHSIDRINNDGNYEPSNCRWATKSEQNRNRRPPKDTGVCRRGNRFHAYLYLDKHQVSLGYFATPEDAASARRIGEKIKLILQSQLIERNAS